MAIQASGLRTYIWNNNLRSGLLLALYPLIIIGMVWAVAFLVGAGMNSYYGSTNWQISAEAAGRLVFHWWPAITGFVLIWFVIAYFLNTKMVRMMARSHPVSRTEEPELYNLLENLCIARGVAMPRLEIIETRARNAFASGIDRKSYTITVTRGLLHCLQKDELEAVLAHELSHIINRDVRLLIISVIFTGMIGFLAQMVWNSVRYSMLMGRGRRDGRGIILIFLVAAILWVGYLATVFTRFALSRRREYLADAGAVTATKNPEAMMRALLRISGRDRIPETTDDVALMCIENTRPFMGLFMTHPPIEKRVAALSAMTGVPVPQIKPGTRAGDDERFKAPDDSPSDWLTARRGKRKNPWH